MSTFPALFAELIQRNYTDEEIVLIAGKNFLRVFKDVERVSDEILAEELPDETTLPPQVFDSVLRLLTNVTIMDPKGKYSITNDTCRPTAGTSNDPD